MRYLDDGTPISSHINTEGRNSKDHRTMFGLYRGIIIKTIYPDSPENTSKERVEYAVKIRGQVFPNAVMLRDSGGGVFNYGERIAKGIEKSYSGEIRAGTYDENLDGEAVYVLFLEGYVNVPVIVGFSQHSKQYKKLKKDVGLLDVKEFNGVEISIDKDSNYVVKQVGRKDVEGKILNEDAVNSMMKLFGNGDFEINTDETNTDLKIKLTKADKKFEVLAQENSITMGADGIVVKDKFNNEIILNAGKITINAAGDAKIQTSGKADLTIGGDATISANGSVNITGTGQAVFSGTGGTTVGSSSSLTNVNGQLVNLAGGGSPVARLGDMAIGTGNMGAPVICTISQGSPKVTSG